MVHAEIDSAVAGVLAGVVASGETAGVVAGVHVADRAPSSYAFGAAAVDRDDPIGAESRLPVGSLTKQFTAACIALLWDRGRLALDDPLEAYVPQARRLAPISLGQLVHHTSGLPKIASRTGDDPWVPVSVAHRLDALDPAACLAPGTRYRYSNLNYWLLGRVVEVASGTSYPSFLYEHVLRPLGMNDSSCDPACQTVGGHTGRPGALRRTRDWHPEWLGSAAVIVSTAPDLLRWDAGLPALLSQAAREIVFAPDPATGAVRYAGGWIVSRQNGAPFVWHNGEIGGFQSANVLLPGARAAVCVLTNADGLEGPTADPLFLAQHIADCIAPGPKVDTEPRVHAAARELAERRFDPSRFSGALRRRADAGAVEALRSEALGPVVALRAFAAEPADGGERFCFSVRYRRHQRTLTMVVDRDGLIDDFSFAFLNFAYGPTALRK
jgi:CubicO group peptidase (beta-lactamase class C family)